MAALLLAEVTGGKVFLGFIAAVAFATILAVVAGLTLAGATTLSHDLYVSVFRSGKTSEADEMRVAKRATLGLGLVAILLGLAFKGQNVAFMVASLAWRALTDCTPWAKSEPRKKNSGMMMQVKMRPVVSRAARVLRRPHS